MILIFSKKTPPSEIEKVSQEIETWENIVPEKLIDRHQNALALWGETTSINPDEIRHISPFIEEICLIEKPYKRASLEFSQGEYSNVTVKTPTGAVAFGKNQPLVIIGGPCSVENSEMILQTARAIKATGGHFLRGGAYKPRTSPYAFQGHGEDALKLLAQAKEATGLGIITEVMDIADVDRVGLVADILQIGARNMYNYPLLRKVGSRNKPVLLKRGLSATIEEWLMAAEYILDAGNPNVILCERGIRGFDRKYTRNILDLSVIPVLRSLTRLPIVIDPSHATGKSEYVPKMAMAAIAAGADSLMIEVHPNPALALSDGPQSLTLENFVRLMQDMMPLAQFCGKGQTVYPTVPITRLASVHR